MKKKTCCFTGHRCISNDKILIIKQKLRCTLINLIQNGYLYFGAGGALGFDTFAELTILELKKEYPNIRLILVLPCINHTKYWNTNDVETYKYIKSKCDKWVYISNQNTTNCIKERNKHLVDNSRCCICYLTKTYGGTAYTVNYAIKKGLNVINIATINT